MHTSGNIQWLDPWRAVSDAEARGFEDELKQEVGKQHPLFGIKVRAIGRRDDQDDVLFALEGSPPRVAVVHLSWRGKEEKGPRWPHPVIFASLSDWVEKEMKPDHEGGDVVI